MTGWDKWSNYAYSSCNYCIPNHYCQGTPVSCGNGTFLNTLVAATSSSCITCPSGYLCIKDWHGKIKVYPGTFSKTIISGSSKLNECPEGRSCASNGSMSNCPNREYSGKGQIDCVTSPFWLKFSNHANRSQVGKTSYSYMNKAKTNDSIETQCSNYCPGNGISYTLYPGLHVSGTTIISNTPGRNCHGGQNSNGGSPCTTCSQLKTDWSNCSRGNSHNVKTQFARSFLNRNNNRENKYVRCLHSADQIGRNENTKSGANGAKCNIEGSEDGFFPQNKCDGIRSTNMITLIGGLKNKHATQPYLRCSWCPDDVNCLYNNIFFSFFRGYMFSCPYDQYSANGNLDCQRKKSDIAGFCPDGFYKTIYTSDQNDQWVHNQDKIKVCLPINMSPTNATFVATDLTKTPDCGVGTWLRYGIQGCQENAAGFLNAGNQYSSTVTKCISGYNCNSGRIFGDRTTSQQSCPKGSRGVIDGSYSELEQ